MNEGSPKHAGSHRHSLRYASAFVAIVGLYFGGGVLGLSAAQINTQVTLVWPPTGIATAALLLGGPGFRPAIALGALAVNLKLGASWAVASAIASPTTCAICSPPRLSQGVSATGIVEVLAKPCSPSRSERDHAARLQTARRQLMA